MRLFKLYRRLQGGYWLKSVGVWRKVNSETYYHFMMRDRTDLGGFEHFCPLADTEFGQKTIGAGTGCCTETQQEILMRLSNYG